MPNTRMNLDLHDKDLCNSFLVKGFITLRGTEAWDDREQARKDHGNICMSFGSIQDSESTRGKTSKVRYIP